MTLKLSLAALALMTAGAAAARDAPLRNPVLLNIGFVCKWNERCMTVHERAMKRALKYVRKYDPPQWKIQLCNRNASRKRTRVDWVGFYNCIRNESLRPPRRNLRR